MDTVETERDWTRSSVRAYHTSISRSWKRAYIPSLQLESNQTLIEIQYDAGGGK